jgi:hypothetical protein
MRAHLNYLTHLSAPHPVAPGCPIAAVMDDRYHAACAITPDDREIRHALSCLAIAGDKRKTMRSIPAHTQDAALVADSRVEVMICKNTLNYIERYTSLLASMACVIGNHVVQAHGCSSC